MSASSSTQTTWRKGIAAVDFGPERQRLEEAHRAKSSRELFYYLLNVDEFTDVLPAAACRVRDELARVRDEELPKELASFDYRAERLRERLLEVRRAHVAARKSVGPRTPQQRERLLRELAPSALLDGAWLQEASSAATHHTPIGVRLLALYAKEVGSGSVRLHHGNLYRDQLQAAGIRLPDVGSWTFSEQIDVVDASFRAPVFELGLSQFSRVFLPELLGYTLHYYVAGIAPAAIEATSGAFYDAHRIDENLDDGALCALSCVEIFMEDAGDDAEAWARVWNGFAMRHVLVAEWQAVLERVLATFVLTPRDRMIALIVRKAPYARGYHRDNAIGGKRIDDWLARAATEPDKLVDALAQSKHVVPGDSGASGFLRELTSFGGPMFRIFSPEELDTIAAWIDSLPKAGQSVAAPEIAPAPVKKRSSSPRADAEAAAAFRAASAKSYAGSSPRRLYHALVNVDLFPAVLPEAALHAERWLDKARLAIDEGRAPKGKEFFPYRHHAFDDWYEQRHRSQIEAYKAPTDPPPFSRANVAWLAMQLAPAPLIDGTWVQRAARAGASHTEISALLFNIYWDEVGNGDEKLNHANIYRDLLAELDVTLPRFDSMEFADDRRIAEASFVAPAFQMALSMFPKRFLPEILGYNLASEINTLGKGYMDLIDVLRHHKVNPYFFELHNVIDNASTGHTAWARDAVRIHLDEMLARGGEPLMAEQWKRIWAGYRSFDIVLSTWITRVALTLGPPVAVAFVRQKLKRLTGRPPALS